MEFTVPRANATKNPGEIKKIQKIITNRGLCGLANNNKWDKLLTFMRKKEGWIPSYRFKCIDAVNGYIADWDVEWWHHLPFPFVSVEWFDIGYFQEIYKVRLIKPDVIDHSLWIEELLSKIRFEFEKGVDFYRIFGYSPKNYEQFEKLC